MNNRKHIETPADILHAFIKDARVLTGDPFGNGHINDTLRVDTIQADGTPKTYIIQKINKTVFTKPDEVMENIVNVTHYLADRIREEGGNPAREVLHFYPAADGLYYVIDDRGEYWRCMDFLEGATSYDHLEDPTYFYESGYAFGRFQQQLSAYPAHTLHETISGFHDTRARYKVFEEAVRKDAFSRAQSAAREIEGYLSRKNVACMLMELMDQSLLPLRVTHNDTKLNNIMIDDATGKAICVLDLDTVMPGLSVNDFGDSIRFGASTAVEDEPDLNKVSLDLNLYELYTKGFIAGCGGRLTPAELENLPAGALVMTYEVGMRFLTDYLQGDVYFKTAYPTHNLVRCRTQLKLVEEMEAHWEEMHRIVRKYA